MECRGRWEGRAPGPFEERPGARLSYGGEGKDASSNLSLRFFLLVSSCRTSGCARGWGPDQKVKQVCKSEGKKGGRGSAAAAARYFFSRAHRKRLTWPRFIISAHSASYWDSIITPDMLFNCSQFSSFSFKITCPGPFLQRGRISLACFSTRAIFNSARVITSYFGSFLQTLQHQGPASGVLFRNGSANKRQRRAHSVRMRPGAFYPTAISPPVIIPSDPNPRTKPSPAGGC